MATAPGTATGIAPMFLVDDVERTAEWYRDHLGFEIGEYFRDNHHEHDADGNHIDPADDLPGAADDGDTVFVILNRDGCRLMFGKTTARGLGVLSNTSFKQYSSDAYLWVEGVREIYAFAKSSGAHIDMHLEKQFYGLTEFRVRDCDGRVLTVGGEE
jgi:uncharacterized glyoxalase superfamily protein PhnB